MKLPTVFGTVLAVFVRLLGFRCEMLLRVAERMPSKDQKPDSHTKTVSNRSKHRRKPRTCSKHHFSRKTILFFLLSLRKTVFGKGVKLPTVFGTVFDGFVWLLVFVVEWCWCG